MRCPFPSKPLRHMFWWTATSELLSRSALVVVSGVAKRLRVLGDGAFVGGPHIGPLFGPGAALMPPKRLIRFEQAASEVEVTSGC